MGSKRKFWFLRDDDAWLFKQIRPNTGEDWAEKISEGLCDLLNLPHASYELAQWGEHRGAISKSFLPAGGGIVFGNEILFTRDPDYPRKGRGSKTFYRTPQHTVGAVMEVMENPDVQFPAQWNPPRAVVSAADAFCGYLLLDAWVGNTDRHHENWGLVLAPSEKGRYQAHLSPTFDHASSLASHITDRDRETRMTTRDQGRSIEAFATRAPSAFFASKSDKRPLTTFDAFLEAGKRKPKAGRAWLAQLASISDHSVTDLVGRVPARRISQSSSDFVLRLLQVNRRRLLESAG